jgi:hypothetical protein
VVESCCNCASFRNEGEMMFAIMLTSCQVPGGLSLAAMVRHSETKVK